MSGEREQYRVTNLVGVPTDYSKKDSWAHLPGSADKAVDTFFVYPTVYNDPTPGAPASENLGDRLPVMPEVGTIATEFHEHRPGLADAQLDLERGVVISTTMAEHYV